MVDWVWTTGPSASRKWTRPALISPAVVRPWSSLWRTVRIVSAACIPVQTASTTRPSRRSSRERTGSPGRRRRRGPGRAGRPGRVRRRPGRRGHPDRQPHPQSAQRRPSRTRTRHRVEDRPPAVLEILSRCGGPTGIAKAGRRKLSAIATGPRASDGREAGRRDHDGAGQQRRSDPRSVRIIKGTAHRRERGPSDATSIRSRAPRSLQPRPSVSVSEQASSRSRAQTPVRDRGDVPVCSRSTPGGQDDEVRGQVVGASRSCDRTGEHVSRHGLHRHVPPCREPRGGPAAISELDEALTPRLPGGQRLR
ncbi:hypothetical protein F4560_003242 [Saccharothrix ecbatanensis]|uniref:Uncharacterized protein n=1 Tax=Saccharothrix ecbatanensis TaxID=1105145 RepID=A0A7W9M105_9PSEU|nr:hypothetical protein [Saccharothrix ecbatanensis]